MVDKSLRAGDFKLTAILDKKAVINNKVVQVGEMVGEAKVLDVRDNAVVLQHGKYSDGPTIELHMNSGLLTQP